MKKKILLLAILICSVFAIYMAIYDIEKVVSFIDMINHLPNVSKDLYISISNQRNNFIVETIFDVFTLFVLLFSFFFIAKNTHHAIRYTYEEYKAKMDAKKAEIKEKKLQSKKERLQKELEKMEKAE